MGGIGSKRDDLSTLVSLGGLCECVHYSSEPMLYPVTSVGPAGRCEHQAKQLHFCHLQPLLHFLVALLPWDTLITSVSRETREVPGWD